MMHADIYEYFKSCKDYFWQWEDNGEVLAIPGGNTIAYNAFLKDVLEKLAPQGLPPFGALLLAVIATNPNGAESVRSVHKIVSGLLKTNDDLVFSRSIAFLELLCQVPESFKQGKKRLMLFQAVFESCHHILSLKTSQSLVEKYVKGNFEKTHLALPQPFFDSFFRKDFRTLEVLSNKYSDVNALLEKIASLPNIEEEVIIEEPLENSDNQEFTEQLVNNPKTFHVGSLVKRIWGGLNIPVHSALPSQQPLGGVSDLTNKGDFDKLLISEFANDDIVFLSRLANNEALFIHREIPPASNSFARIILMDISLKNWGTPKTIAFATMLAIAKHPKTNIACSAFVIGNGYHSVAIDSVETIIEGLQHLDGSLHAANGMEAFFKAYPPDKNREIFLITEPTTLKQAAMSKAMSDYHACINYLVYTDAGGNIDIYKKQQSSKKHIQHILLPLETLWAKEVKPTPKQEKQTGNYYPILFRTSLNIKKVLKTADGDIYQVTGDKSLLRLYDKNAKIYERGWELVLEKLPQAHGEFEIGILSGTTVLLSFNPHNRELDLVNLATEEKTSFTFNEWKSTAHAAFIFYEQRFYHLNPKGCWAISPAGITEEAPLEKKLFEDRAKETAQLSNAFYVTQSIIKNIKEVFINEEDKLVVNTHELSVNKGGHLKLDKTNKLTKRIDAEKESDTRFVFPGGSSVEINRTGMIILKSVNTSIPAVYIPAVLDGSLGIATETSFAGNAYYRREQQFELTLSDPGPNKLPAVKVVKEYTTLGLKDAKELVDAAPSRVLNYASEKDAAQLDETFNDIGAKSQISPVKGLQVKKQDATDTLSFYRIYIKTFIDIVTQHGAKN